MITTTKKKIILFIHTVCFFTFMLAGTLFGQKVGDLFRPAIIVQQPEYRKINYETTVSINGEDCKVVTEQLSLLVPLEALIWENGYFVYLLQTHTETFGTYYTIERRSVNIEIQNSYVIIETGLNPDDYIVPDIQKMLESANPLKAGQRIVPLYP